MAPLLTLLLALQQGPGRFTQSNAPSGTGDEWLTIFSVLVPAVLLIVLVYLGSRKTV